MTAVVAVRPFPVSLSSNSPFFFPVSLFAFHVMLFMGCFEDLDFLFHDHLRPITMITVHDQPSLFPTIYSRAGTMHLMKRRYISWFLHYDR